MREVPDSITDGWLAQDKIGDKRPVVRATVQRQNLRRYEYDTAWAQGGSYGAQKHRPGHFSSFIFGDLSPLIELRNIRAVEWERSVGQDAATMTLTLMNSEIIPIGSPKDNPLSPDEFDKPGYYTYSRGDETVDPSRWGYDEQSAWNWLIVPDSVIKTYEGYGTDKTKPAGDDPFLMQTGVWLIDKVTYASNGDISIDCRDLARILLENVVFPPAVPFSEYPLSWTHNHTESVASRDAQGGTWTDRLNRFGSASSSNDIYVGISSLTNHPYTAYVGDNSGVEGHHALDAIKDHDGSEDNDLFWRSTGQDAGRDFVWWQYNVDSGTMPVNALRLRMSGGPYRVYVSIHNGTKWVGTKKIPYSTNGNDGSPGNIDIGAKIPFVSHMIADRYFEFDHLLPRAYDAKRIRLTFTRLREAAVGEHPFRAGLREMKVYTAGSTGALSFGAGYRDKVIGNYGDYCADSSTEILTRRGWLTWDQVQPGDETLAVNNQGRSEWTVIESVFREPRQRKMLSMESQVHSSLTTPDHRWLTRDHKGRAEWRTTETLKHGHSIPLTATRADHPQEAKYVDALVETVAWFWTEGWTHAQGGCVNAYLSQSRSANPAYCERIEAALTALAGPASVKTGRTVSWSLKERADGVVTYRLGQGLTSAVLDAAPDKVVSPEFLTALTQAQLSLFIETSVDADGWRTSGVRRISQASEARIRAFEMACALAGEGTSTVERDGNWYTTILKSRFFRPALARREEVDYDGVIWCPTLEHHNWLARRNGKVYFTGNTQIVKWVCAWAGWYWPPHATGDDFIKTSGDNEKNWVTFNNPDPALPKGRVWGDFMKSGTHGIADLTVDLFDKKPLMDIINYVRDLLGFLFFIDECGGVIWRMPNLGMAGSPKLGNYLAPEDPLGEDGQRTIGNRGRFGRTSEIITLDENETLLSWSTTLDSASIRDRIFVANAVGGVGVVIKGFNPNPVGFRRVAGWSDQHFKNKHEAVVMADMISAQQMFSWKLGQAVIPGNPAIQVDDQVRIYERVTNETFYHYVVGIKSSLDMQEGDWTYELTTHWLGERPSDAWVVKVTELSGATQQYLEAIGVSPSDAEDNDTLDPPPLVPTPTPPIDPPPPPPGPLPSPVPIGSGRFPGDPGSGALYYGESKNGGDPTSREALWGRHVGCYRSYFQPTAISSMQSVAIRDLTHKRMPIISSKMPATWAAMASGSQDAWIDSLMSAFASVDGPIWFCPHHEPYDNQGSGQTPADYKAMCVRFMARKASNVAIVPILQSSPFDRTVGGHANLGDWFSAASHDILGLDAYNHWSGVFSGSTMVGTVNRWRTPADVFSVCDQNMWGKPVCIAEWGVRTDPRSSGLAAAWMTDARSYLVARGDVVAMSFFDSNQNVNDGGTPWTLDDRDTERLHQFGVLLANSGNAVLT